MKESKQGKEEEAEEEMEEGGLEKILQKSDSVPLLMPAEVQSV